MGVDFPAPKLNRVGKLSLRPLGLIKLPEKVQPLGLLPLTVLMTLAYTHAPQPLSESRASIPFGRTEG